MVFMILKFEHDFFTLLRILAVEAPETYNKIKWLTYWSIYASLKLFEYGRHAFTYSVPFYWAGKCLFLIWLMMSDQISDFRQLLVHCCRFQEWLLLGRKVILSFFLIFVLSYVVTWSRCIHFFYFLIRFLIDFVGFILGDGDRYSFGFVNVLLVIFLICILFIFLNKQARRRAF